MWVCVDFLVLLYVSMQWDFLSFVIQPPPPAPKKELLLIMISSPHSDIMIYF